MRKSAQLNISNHKRIVRNWALSLISCLMAIVPGCGTEVGNSGKPIISDSSTTASLVGLQHDEVISSILDQSDSDATASFALNQASFAAPPLTCTRNSDGSLELITEGSFEATSEFGQTAKRKTQTDSLDVKLTSKLSVPADLGSLSCSAKMKPVITWNQLMSLNTHSSLTKTRQRSVILKADASILNQSQLQVSSTRDVQFARVASSLDSLTVSRSTSFQSSVQLQRSADATVLSRRVETVSGEPIIVETTRTRRAGISSLVIVKGAVVSTTNEENKILLRYKNLTLSTGSSCHPSSGTIDGEIYAASDSTNAASTFQIEFSADGAVLHYADGTDEDLELEACQI